jgi:CubicO group peptidase (beta-lactamase class C family)
MSGFSEERLERMPAVLGRQLESGRMPGLVALVSRRGETHVTALGTAAFGESEPMRRDSIFRIASVTKPITAAAAMILIEECKLRLDDPVDPWLPELANRQVLRAIDGPIDDTVPANRAITLRDLLTFRLGLGAVMIFPARYPIQHAMEAAGIAPGPKMPAHAPDELMRRFGSVPLLHQPGEAWTYNSGSDILGILIARVSGKNLGAFLRERIFEPLGMKDTGFSIPASDLGRLPASYGTDFATGETVDFDVAGSESWFAKEPVFESGAGGLVSTADDLLAFGEMMLGGGTRGKVRMLSRASVALMTSDQIAPAQKAASPFFPGFWENHGWGFGVSIDTRRAEIYTTPGRFGWDGGFGTSWYVDPVEGLIGVLLTQRAMDSPVPPTAYTDFWTTAYAALEG